MHKTYLKRRVSRDKLIGMPIVSSKIIGIKGKDTRQSVALTNVNRYERWHACPRVRNVRSECNAIMGEESGTNTFSIVKNFDVMLVIMLGIKRCCRY